MMRFAPLSEAAARFTTKSSALLLNPLLGCRRVGTGHLIVGDAILLLEEKVLSAHAHDGFCVGTIRLILPLPPASPAKSNVIHIASSAVTRRNNGHLSSLHPLPFPVASERRLSTPPQQAGNGLETAKPPVLRGTDKALRITILCDG